MRVRMALLVSAVLIPPAAAHDLHIIGSKLRGKIDDETTIYVTWSHGEPVDETVNAVELEHYGLLDPTGSRRELVKRSAGLQANRMKLETEGVYQATAASQPKVVTKIQGKDGGHRHVAGAKSEVAKREPNAKVVSATKSQQFSKALIVVGNGAKAVEPSGLPFDILPLDKPQDWRAGAKLRFKTIYNDAPLTFGKLTAKPVGFPVSKNGAVADEEAWAVEKPIGKTGVVEVTFDKPGRWIVQVERSFEPDAKNRTMYDREDYVTSLTLEIAP